MQQVIQAVRPVISQVVNQPAIRTNIMQVVGRVADTVLKVGTYFTVVNTVWEWTKNVFKFFRNQDPEAIEMHIQNNEEAYVESQNYDLPVAAVLYDMKNDITRPGPKVRQITNLNLDGSSDNYYYPENNIKSLYRIHEEKKSMLSHILPFLTGGGVIGSICYFFTNPIGIASGILGGIVAGIGTFFGIPYFMNYSILNDNKQYYYQIVNIPDSSKEQNFKIKIQTKNIKAIETIDSVCGRYEDIFYKVDPNGYMLFPRYQISNKKFIWSPHKILFNENNFTQTLINYVNNTTICDVYGHNVLQFIIQNFQNLFLSTDYNKPIFIYSSNIDASINKLYILLYKISFLCSYLNNRQKQDGNQEGDDTKVFKNGCFVHEFTKHTLNTNDIRDYIENVRERQIFAMFNPEIFLRPFNIEDFKDVHFLDHYFTTKIMIFISKKQILQPNECYFFNVEDFQ